MTNLERIKSMNIDELVAWLDNNFAYVYDTPWDIWWNSNYCSRCETEIVQVKDSKMKIPCGWCELYHKCKYFQELDSTPDSKQVVKMWLESEIDD